ncbi:MAG: CDP-glycerol glycerophosphotransferase family protein [Lachnospiraceae bacterium]|nr:CDP-glycerol glycerophosphotransferase family protein [Lachnospiraceae bacterium]
MAYIDPGTGTMLFSVVVGGASTVYYLGRKLVMKVKYGTGIKAAKTDIQKKDIIVFSEGKQYSKVFSGILDVLDGNDDISVEYWTMDEQDVLLDNDYKNVKCLFIGDGNKAFVKLNMMNAKVCISTTPGLDVYQWKRSKNVGEYVHIFHSIDEALGYRAFGLDFYDTVLLVGEFQEYYIRMLEKVRGINEKKLEVVGCTYMDELLKRKQGESAEDDNNKNNRTTVLLAPSWGSESILNKFGEEMIDLLNKGDFNLIIRPHPQSLKVEKELIERLKNKYTDITWDFDKDNYQSLNKADVMISDFSSVVFDFAFVFGKPVIYTETELDLSVYDASWIDEELWRFKVVKEIGVKIDKDNIKNLNTIIPQIIKDKKLDETREHLKDDTWAFKGESAKMIATYVTDAVKNYN